MTNSYLDTDAFRELITAVREYREDIHVQKTFLQEAANVCDDQMGHDPISRKKIEKFEEALSLLDWATEKIIEEGLLVINKSLHEIEDIVEEA